MTTRRIGPFEATSFAAGLAAATPLLLIAGMLTGASGNPRASVGAALAIAGLALGAVAAGVFVATYLLTTDKETPR